MLLVPEAYRNHPDLMKNYPEVVDFYEFYEGLQEGWDGPALLVFSDGKRVGARLDRNGLRPARFWRTSDDMIYVASEVSARPWVRSRLAVVPLSCCCCCCFSGCSIAEHAPPHRKARRLRLGPSATTPVLQRTNLVACFSPHDRSACWAT